MTDTTVTTLDESMPTRELLRTFVFSAYDLQMLRMQMGLRLCANFRNKLKKTAAETEEADADKSDDELSDEAQSMLDDLKDSYRRLTDGIARNRTLPDRKGFKGDALISTYTELVLVNQYVQIEKNEQAQFRQFESVLERFPIWTEYLKKQTGIGPAMGAVLIAYFDPARTNHVSDFWAYAGLDVAPDGRGRSRRAEHLVDREYTNKDGQQATRKSVTYNPWLKARLMGALATSFMRTAKCPWRSHYDNYKNRIMTDPNRNRVTLAEYKRAHRASEDTTKMWPPLRIHRAALRYMVKQFLFDLWLNWRRMEGLPVTPSYHEAKMGHVHSSGENRAA